MVNAQIIERFNSVVSEEKNYLDSLKATKANKIALFEAMQKAAIDYISGDFASMNAFAQIRVRADELRKEIAESEASFDKVLVISERDIYVKLDKELRSTGFNKIFAYKAGKQHYVLRDAEYANILTNKQNLIEKIESWVNPFADKQKTEKSESDAEVIEFVEKTKTENGEIVQKSQFKIHDAGLLKAKKRADKLNVAVAQFNETASGYCSSEIEKLQEAMSDIMQRLKELCSETEKLGRDETVTEA